MYSQTQEEHWILQACPEPTGKFLDIGAWNAICLSNTRALFERGWGGVLVEPSPLPFGKIEAEYSGVERVVAVNAAVTIEPVPTVDMWISEDAVSTTDRESWEKWRDHAHFEPEQITVAAVTLEDLYERFGPFDFVSIDTEGTSVDLCLRLFTLGHRPKCICVEHDERIVELMSVAAPLGYAATYMSGENLILVRQ